MKNISKQGKTITKKTLFSFLIVSMLLNMVVFSVPAKAATNLLGTIGSFEGDFSEDWLTWTNGESLRSYDTYRDYEPAFGYGSYSIAIEASGSPEDRWFAGLVTQDSFQVTSGEEYFLTFYAKADQAMGVSMFLENANTYAAITDTEVVNISTSWEKYIITFTPDASVQSQFTFMFGDMPDGAVVNFDGIQLIKSDMTLVTKEVRGYIGDQNKYLSMTNIEYFVESDIEIELPYYDNLTRTATTKIYNPKRMTSAGIYFDMYEQTFAGVGRVYVNGGLVGEFNYVPQPKIDNIHPSLVRVGEDLVIQGSGFMPYASNTYMILTSISLNGSSYETWLTPTNFDSELSQFTYHLPNGVISGRLSVYISYRNTAGTDVAMRSNYISYQVKPVIYNVEWSKRGYEQVGDKIRIYGRGISNRPYVNFYDEDNNKVDTKYATLVQIEDEEIIEVDASTKLNNLNVTVLSAGVESDFVETATYSAKPKLNTITSSYQRQLAGSSNYIKAAKVGDEITLAGQGFRSGTVSDTQVEFEGISGRVIVNVADEDINSYGTSLKVTVPTGTVNGYIKVISTEESSNYMPIEIVPDVVSVSPDPIVPGEEVEITVNGIGDNINLTKVIFSIGSSQTEEVTPNSITHSGTTAVVSVDAPMSMPANNNTIHVQYDRWIDDGNSTVNVTPTIVSASINMDTKILSIRGYGFSTAYSENVITYMYADEDHTVIQPSVRMLGVYPSEEGQEIRVQILDEYHYGYVRVTVGERTSEEVNFGPASITNIARRVEYVAADDAVRGVLYISGYNFGSSGSVQIGEETADVHYRTNFFIIAVVDEAYINDNPVVVNRD